MFLNHKHIRLEIWGRMAVPWNIILFSILGAMAYYTAAPPCPIWETFDLLCSIWQCSEVQYTRALYECPCGCSPPRQVSGQDKACVSFMIAPLPVWAWWPRHGHVQTFSDGHLWCDNRNVAYPPSYTNTCQHETNACTYNWSIGLTIKLCGLTYTTVKDE